MTIGQAARVPGRGRRRGLMKGGVAGGRHRLYMRLYKRLSGGGDEGGLA